MHYVFFKNLGVDLKSSDDDETATEEIVNEETAKTKDNELILGPIPLIRTSASTISDNLSGETGSDEDTQSGNHLDVGFKKATIMNKRLRSIQSLPYFSLRPASETDIFTIAGSARISMTPEIPSISYSVLPKHFEDTPTIEKYKESTSLYSIQTTNNVRAREFDFSMPRYFGKSDMIAKSVDNLSTNIKPLQATPKKIEKSKRLKVLRANLPPLSIHINKEKSKERNIE